MSDFDPAALLNLFVDSGSDYHKRWQEHQSEDLSCDPEGLCESHWEAIRWAAEELERLREVVRAADAMRQHLVNKGRLDDDEAIDAFDAARGKVKL